MAKIVVEVVYALPERWALLCLGVPAGTNVCEAALLSGIVKASPGPDIRGCSLSILGKLLARPEEWVLEAGERVKIYHPLIADPREVRKQCTAQARSEYEGGQSWGSLRK